MQDSRAKRKVIGDEERMIKFPFDLNEVPPIRLTDMLRDFQLHLKVRGQQGTTTSAGPSQLLNNDEVDSTFVTQLEEALAETDWTALKSHIGQLNDAFRHMKAPLQILSTESADLSQFGPYSRLILSIALQLTRIFDGQEIIEDVWIYIVKHLIHYGFSRREVELILRTAGYDDIKLYITSYDQIMAALSEEDILNFVLLIEPDSTEIADKFAIRSANLIASRTEFDQALTNSKWADFLGTWNRAGYDRDKVEKYLDKTFLSESDRHNLLRYYTALISKRSV
ncbi:uncharacterized protein PHALS_11297 [Plasmopara halstedii]|uniref:Uncharacterized protein n=1 Tax=Plasmopara halstedii TaxID=4781 RepID=A0A0P1AIZ1_PLAHL|nr:uncharacterized protein PHALS_11297 [Plasmopara halstedii]CEG41132.1 hypothetical protein PHALS_11297 [Plasmopara halstedii]|eukprot:XP_024577501.1 hypothetical protein PHALS_11297 [Plasmopara halstedii]